MKNKIPVLLWLYHLDLWPEFFALLLPLKNFIDLRIGLCADNDNSEIERCIKANFCDYQITYHPNAGVDVLPFLQQLDNLDIDKHPFFLKIHSKRSLFIGKFNWRIMLLHSLLGNSRIFLDNVKLLERYNHIGMITNKHFILSKQEHNNSLIIANILEDILDLSYDDLSNGIFPGGNMFFGQTDIFKKYFSTNIITKLAKHLVQETGHVTDIKHGTYCHSLERIFGYIIGHENKKIVGGVIPTIKVLNHQALDSNHRLHIILMYDNLSCCLLEDMHVCGKVLLNNSESMKIQWYHLAKPVIKTYKYINSNTIITRTNEN